MRVTETALPGVLLIEPRVIGDARGYFLEAWHAERYAEAGVPAAWVQDNLSMSRRGVLRGLHVQHPDAQGKLVSVLHGEVYDVAVDVRCGSPSLGRWVGYSLSSENHRQLYIPPGFAHGFLVTSESALVSYKVSTRYQPEHDRAIAWNDPDLCVRWPGQDPVLSPKDAAAPRLRDMPRELLPAFVP